MEKELINHIINIKETLGGVHTKLGEQDKVLDRLLVQTTKTNDRVNDLESTTRTLVSTNEKLTQVATDYSGLYKALQDEVREKYSNHDREINELKKQKQDDVEVTKTKIGAKSTIGVALIGAISGLIALFK
jgi:chromosome segregation ATPase